MKEKIYTIPVNEAFDKKDGCPFCTLYRLLQENEVEGILGPAMMEPDIRIQTNREGFCGRHYSMMLQKKRRLQLGLILESHLAEVKKGQKSGGFLSLKGVGTEQMNRLQALEDGCYVCRRIDESFSKMLACAAQLWQQEREFREKTAAQPYFCLPHYRAFVKSAREQQDKKTFSSFWEAVSGQMAQVLEKLEGDVSWFCKKFDYRYDEEPWYDAKDSLERAVKILSGEQEREETQSH